VKLLPALTGKEPYIKVDGGTPGPTCTSSGSHSGGAALRRKQRERLKNKHLENPGHGKVKSSADVASTALRRRMVIRL
jgi:hypothetical protein